MNEAPKLETEAAAAVQVGTADDGAYEITIRIRPPSPALGNDERREAAEYIQRLQGELDQLKKQAVATRSQETNPAVVAQLRDLTLENQKLNAELESALRALNERSIELQELQAEVRNVVRGGR